MTACMYGTPHAGDAFVVRNKLGKTISGLCSSHYEHHYTDLLKRGFYCHSAEEMQARGEEHCHHDGREDAGTNLAEESGQPREHDYVDDPGLGETQFGAPQLQPVLAGALPRTPGDLARGNDQADRASAPGPNYQLAKAGVADGQLDLRAPGRGASAGGRGRAGPDPRDAFAWWHGAGQLTLTPEQRDILEAPFDDAEVTIRYDGVVYAPWRRYWARMVRAFAPFVPAILPLGDPKTVGDSITVDVVMVCNGMFIGRAWGSHRSEGENTKMAQGDRIEAAISDGLSKIGKRLNMGEALWTEEYRDYWKSQYAECYETKRGPRWRRKGA